MHWLFGSQSRGIDATVRRQNPDLRHLAQTLEVQKGIDLLENGKSLSAALDASLGDAHLFRTALIKAEASAKEAMSFVSTGFQGEEELVETGNSLFRQAKSLKTLMSHDES